MVPEAFERVTTDLAPVRDRLGKADASLVREVGGGLLLVCLGLGFREAVETLEDSGARALCRGGET